MCINFDCDLVLHRLWHFNVSTDRDHCAVATKWSLGQSRNIVQIEHTGDAIRQKKNNINDLNQEEVKWPSRRTKFIGNSCQSKCSSMFRIFYISDFGSHRSELRCVCVCMRKCENLRAKTYSDAGIPPLPPPPSSSFYVCAAFGRLIKRKTTNYRRIYGVKCDTELA